MSFGTLKVEKGLCRCCFNDGSYTSLSDPCLELGQQEVYASMLQKYLGIDLSPVPGALCAATYKICDECIQRLSDACHFKKQVLECEKRFQQLYGKSIIQVVTNSTFEIQVKEETDHGQDVKPEDDEGDDEGDDDYGSSFQYDEIEDDDDDFEMNLDLQELKQAKKIKIEKVATVKSKPKLRPSKPAVKLTVKPTAKPTVKPTAKPAVKPTVKSKKDGDSGKKGHPDYYHLLDSQYVCNLCQRAFASQPLVSQHYRFVHLNRRPRERKCPHCDKKLPAHLRTYHLEEAHGVPAPSCNICQKRFRFPCLLLKHQKKIHMGETFVACSVCDKRFFDKNALKPHMITHSSEKRFKCDLCGQEFRWKNNLKDHILVHMGDNRYRYNCGVCGKGYFQKSSLNYHVRRNHS